MSTFNSTLPDCTVAPDSAASDAGVAGAGILLAFIITAFLALFLSAFIVLSELRAHSKRYHNIPRQILQGLSDQQIVEGIAIQVIGLARINSTIPYHFFIIWLLSLLSTATNFASLLALVQDYKRDWVLRWLRQLAMFVNMVLTIVYGVFVLENNLERLSPTLPIACVWVDHAKSDDGHGDSTISVIGTIAVIAASCIIFALGTVYLHLRKTTWGGIVRCIALLVLFAIAIGATIRVIMISQAFGHPSVNLADDGEKIWSFGQLLTMLLLVLPLVSALEIFRGQLQVPHSDVDGDADQIPLTGGATGELKHGARYTYQSNPFHR